VAKNKVGRFSLEEMEFIQKHAASMSPLDIARRLNRTKAAVQEYIDRFYAPKAYTHPAGSEVAGKDSPDAIRKELRQSELWKRLRQELSQEELGFFDEEYVKMMSQFKGDVLPTEESQIFDAIKLEILKSRNLVERRKSREDIRRLEEQRDVFLRGFSSLADMTGADRDRALSYETSIQAAKAADQSRTAEYDKLQQRKDAIMKTMKATRDQRFKEVESAKESILGLFKKLQLREEQAKESRAAVLMDMATKREYERLSAAHVYEDGKEDRPVLNAETVQLQGEKNTGGGDGG
jgi:hypothetical protein